MVRLGVDDKGLDEVGSEVDADVRLARRMFCWASHGVFGLTGYLHRWRDDIHVRSKDFE